MDHVPLKQTKSRMTKFPQRLHQMLEVASHDDQLSKVVSWLPCGTAFRVHDPRSFRKTVLPTFFPGMKDQKSFRRQLNLYGIRQRGLAISEVNMYGRAIGAYWHPLMQRGRPDLSAQLRRSPRGKTTEENSSKESSQRPKPLSPTSEALSKAVPSKIGEKFGASLPVLSLDTSKTKAFDGGMINLANFMPASLPSSQDPFPVGEPCFSANEIHNEIIQTFLEYN